MIRILFLLITLGIGFSLGIKYERLQMRAECDNGEGDWTGTICVNSELLQ